MGEIIGLIIVAVVVGFVLFLLELLTPTFGVFTVVGLAAMGTAVYLAFTISSVFGTLLLVALIFAIPAYYVLLVRLLPRSRFSSKLFLGKAMDGSGGGTPEADSYRALMGKKGTTETSLRPSGAIRIEGRRVIAVAESGIIEQGKTVKVIKAKGTDVVVRCVD